jgi:hypothetical protein
MEWIINIPETEKEIPSKIMQLIINGFLKMTGGQVELVLSDIKYQYSKLPVGLRQSLMKNSVLKSHFQYEVCLRSKYIADYSFEVLSFGYEMDLDKVEIVLDKTILLELDNGKVTDEKLCIDNGDSFIRFLHSIFNTKKFKNEASGAVKIANENKNSKKE